MLRVPQKIKQKNTYYTVCSDIERLLSLRRDDGMCRDDRIQENFALFRITSIPPTISQQFVDLPKWRYPQAHPDSGFLCLQSCAKCAA